MPNNTVRAAATGLPNAKNADSMDLLKMIVGRLDLGIGDFGNPELIGTFSEDELDQIAAWKSERKKLDDAGRAQQNGVKSMGTFESSFSHEVGDSVVVEVAGKVVVRQETEHGFKYIVQPHNPRAAAVHASPEYVFPEDDDAAALVGSNLMCERCADNHEATHLLLMLISKIHASNKDGGARLRIDLTESEMDRLCAWGAMNEDTEDDDPPEDDGSPEESENLESDCRIRFGEGETTNVAGLPWRRGDRVIVEIGEAEIVGTVRAHKLGRDWPRYVIGLEDLAGATLEVDSCHVYPALKAAAE